MFGNDVPNNILKAGSPPSRLQLFLIEVLTPYTEFEEYFFVNISFDTHFGGKSFEQKLVLVKFFIN